jgi:hypothetical protein
MASPPTAIRHVWGTRHPLEKIGALPPPGTRRRYNYPNASYEYSYVFSNGAMPKTPNLS